MESIAYMAAVLGYLAGECNAHAPSVIAKAVLQLCELNALLHQHAVMRGEGEMSELEKELLKQAQAEVEKLRDVGFTVDLRYNDVVPSGYPGSRLRLELPGTSWDADDPLYIAALRGKTA